MGLLLRIIGRLFVLAGLLWMLGLSCIGGFFWLVEDDENINLESGSTVRAFTYAVIALIPIFVGTVLVRIGKRKARSKTS